MMCSKRIVAMLAFLFLYAIVMGFLLLAKGDILTGIIVMSIMSTLFTVLLFHSISKETPNKTVIPSLDSYTNKFVTPEFSVGDIVKYKDTGTLYYIIPSNTLKSIQYYRYTTSTKLILIFPVSMNTVMKFPNDYEKMSLLRKRRKEKR